MQQLKIRLKKAIEKLKSDDEMSLAEVRSLLLDFWDIFHNEGGNSEFLLSIGVVENDYLAITSAIQSCLTCKKGINRNFFLQLNNLDERMDAIYKKL